MRISILFRDNLKISFQSIRANLLRTILTVFIIAFGIMALVGILTAVDSLKASISSSFTNMGANTFSIRNRSWFVAHDSRGERRSRRNEPIRYREVQRFSEEYKFPAIVSVSTWASGSATVKYKSKKTDPNISVIGTDENYIYNAGYEIQYGRNFSLQEIQMNRNVVIIGSGLASNVFEKGEEPLDKIITIGGGKYKVIGVLKEKGAGLGGGGDRISILPITNVRQYFSRPNMTYTISVLPNDAKLLDIALGEAEGIFRIIRKLDIRDVNNFDIQKSDSLANLLIENIKYVTIAATIIGIITLAGAAVGLMNIMLVSVTERTREIGIRKAIGAKASIIKQQFLFEAILIGQFGGLFGILLGILIGNVVTLLTKGAFIVPWVWIIGGVILCFFVGLVSGYFPAVKASRLDPIIALRYE